MRPRQPPQRPEPSPHNKPLLPAASWMVQLTQDKVLRGPQGEGVNWALSHALQAPHPTQLLSPWGDPDVCLPSLCPEGVTGLAPRKKTTTQTVNRGHTGRHPVPARDFFGDATASAHCPSLFSWLETNLGNETCLNSERKQAQGRGELSTLPPRQASALVFVLLLHIREAACDSM